MSKHLASLFVAVFTAPAVLAAQEDGRNRVFAEFMGPGIAYSVNYERSLTDPFGLRVGASGWPEPGIQYLLGFGMLTAQIGRGTHSAVLGLGGGAAWFRDVDLFEEADVVGGYGVAMIGYQLQPRPKGFFMRITYTPFFNHRELAPLWGGVSLGVVF